MKFSQIYLPFVLALFAAIGNALVTIGQKKASPFENPFFFGAFSLMIAAFSLFIIAFLYKSQGVQKYFLLNLKWFSVTGFGLILLNVFLYFLYRNYGANSYTLYSILAIATTSILVSIYYFDEKMNLNYWISLGFATLTIVFFMKGKMS